MKQVVIILVAAGIWVGCGRNKIQPGYVHREEGRPLPAGVPVVTVGVEQVRSRIDVVGTVSAAERVKVAARIQAQVSEVRASAGQRVERGQVLLVLDDREIREQLTAAEAQLRQAEADYDRTRRLFEARTASEQELTAAESAYRSARAQVDRIRVMLSYTEIRSPLTGVVIERHVEVGDLASPGQELMALYDPTRMRLEAAAPVRLIRFLSLGASVPVSVEHPPLSLSGVVAEIVGEIDPRSRTQIVRVDLQRPEADLLPGAFGRLWVETEPRLAIFAPASSVRRVGQLETVGLVRGDRVVDRLVRTGPSVGGRVEILAGLADGDVILAEAR
ncbi:MAG: efflux RND transporter periplasmic adaptor subunit [Kiritimatiellae bacterium]|nr:efflux RND transporter periplasmic adaptor subunit [Kiritimatiellia bacterium]MDW8458847.1 efflux RND transporter periplasmic adaptor subunit [Verrucomicrobiota bacterium]